MSNDKSEDLDTNSKIDSKSEVKDETKLNTTKKGKQSKKKAVDPKLLTPEYIEEQRRLRNLKKEQRKNELIAKGLSVEDLDVSLELKFIKRPQLAIPQIQETEGIKIKIMSYNVLAQALIRRKLFPTSGNALKWSTRSKVLLSEFKYYDADILCLQEVDFVQYSSYWTKEFQKLGYSSKYYRANSKNHGVAIVYKSNIFVCKNQSFIDYDRETSGDILPRTITQNVGMLAYLEFLPEIRKKYPGISRNGIIIGTTHLFWHPFGTFERTRQTYLVLKKFQEFYNTLDILNENNDGFYSFFAGDFNSQPFDSPYLSITSKPIKYVDRANIVLGCSLSYQYSRNRGIVEGGDREDEEEEEEEGGNIEKFGKDQPRDPCPESFTPTEDQSAIMKRMENLHNSLDMRAISLYSAGYHLVDPENAGRDNERNEPFFSNWAHAWRGLLDYIFVISKWDKNVSYSKRIDTISEIVENQNIKLLKLLKLPKPEDMGPEPSGQPRLGQYPSDHLCLMAEVELC